MASFGSKKNWGDAEEDEGYLPEPVETAVDAKGIKTRTEYRLNDLQQKIKVVKKIRVRHNELRLSKAAVARRARLEKFGNVRSGGDESNSTIVDYNEVKMVHPKQADQEDEGQAANVKNAFEAFQKKQQWRALHRKYDGDEGDLPPGDDEGEARMGMGGGGGDGAGGKYVPPSMRGGGGAGTGLRTGSLATMTVDESSIDEKDLKTIRVSNLSEDTKEADLQDLFQPFGSIFRIYLAKDKETMTSRGFAFVSFNRREDAEVAMNKLQGYGYDHLILRLEWAKPSGREGGAGGGGGGGGGQFRSGYGKALAQDTDQKVSFASNLTR